MISKYKYKNLTWIDLESPTKEEVLHIKEEYELPPLVAEELSIKTTRSKVDLYRNAIYLILHFPTVSHKHGPSTEAEIDFVIGKDFLITTHYEFVDPLHDFSKVFEVNSILDKSDMGEHAGYLFFYIMRELYKHTETELEDINGTLMEIERNIFAGQESKMVQMISRTNRMLVDIRQATRFHKETLQSFDEASKIFLGKDFSYHSASILGEYEKVKNTLDSHKEILNELRETNDSLLSLKTTDTIKTLTIMSFVMMPLSLIAAIFSMDSNVIFIKDLHDFFSILAVMGMVVLLMLIYFRRKKWL